MSDDTHKESHHLDDFLNPASMLTPGFAGSMTMLITNALSVQFELAPSWIGLIVSFLCGTLVFAASVSLLKKLVYYVLNSLIIFSVAAGTSGFAAKATTSAALHIALSPAHAADSRGADPAHRDPAYIVAQTSSELQIRLDAALRDLEKAEREAEQARQAAEEALRASQDAQEALQQLEEQKADLQRQLATEEPARAVEQASPKASFGSKQFFKSWF